MKLHILPRQTVPTVFLAVALLFSGCATAVNGGKQKVPIASQPSGASVKIDDADSGATPTTVVLSRKTSHRVELQLNGYRPYEVILEPRSNGATAGNLLVGGIIGMAVDGSSGAGNTLHPEKVDAVLLKK